ncbi:hypothetical protein ACIQXF_10225 [Lysinibacillus sp. NPDC097231]|uniref:hypothetical protein n=1 Tax=Lysinibacillus sp. NPDC097231 TaxID=3364142 RepID=UPI0037F6D428
MASRRKKKSSRGSNLLSALFILILVGTISGGMALKNFVSAEVEYKKLKGSFNEKEFKEKLIPSHPIIEALKQEFLIDPEETLKSSYSNPTSIESFDIENGDSRISIQVATYHKGTYVDSIKNSNVTFDEIEGKLQWIHIIASKDNVPIDSQIMKRAFKAISKGLGYELNDNQIVELTTALKDENTASPYPNSYLTYRHQDEEASGELLVPWSNQVLLRTVDLDLLVDEEVETAFKVIYKIKEKK